MNAALSRGLGTRQEGAAAAEYAVVSVVFFGMVLAVIEFSHLMFVYSTVVEATRLGARVAAVCDVSDVTVKARMQTILPLLTPEKISITYPSGTCSASACEPLTVSVQGLIVPLSIPLAPLAFRVPAFSTSIPGESLSSADNPICD